MGLERRECGLTQDEVTNALGGVTVEELLQVGNSSLTHSSTDRRQTERSVNPIGFANILIGAANSGEGGSGNATVTATRSLQDVVIRDHKAGVPLTETVDYLRETSDRLDKQQQISIFGPDIIKSLKRQIDALREVDPRLTSPQFPIHDLHYYALLAAYETAMFSPVDHRRSIKNRYQRVPLFRERAGQIRPSILVDDNERIMTSLQLLNGLMWPKPDTSGAARIDGSRTFSVVPLLNPVMRGRESTFHPANTMRREIDPHLRNIAGLAVRVTGGVNGARMIAKIRADSLGSLPPLFVDELYKLLYIQTRQALEWTVRDPAIARLSDTRYANIGAFAQAMQ